MHLTAGITNISRASLHDGPGVRTVVYFKGCNLRCKWCHNPETISQKPEILYIPTKCIHCGKCVDAFPQCHTIEDGNMKILRDVCVGCGKCADLCPSGALSLSCNNMTVDGVMKEIHKDKPYFLQSGGVTLSGGECLLHGDFCARLLEACKAEQIHTMIETALFVPWQQIEKVLPHCDGFFADFKIPDPEKHRQYTAQANDLILTNLHRLANAAPGKVTVRIPLIPGVNDSSPDIQGFADKLSPFAGKLSAIEVLRYNPLAQSKYRHCGKDYTDFGEAQSDEFMLAFCARLEEALAYKAKVFTLL